jgi:hypothetical protein
MIGRIGEALKIVNTTTRYGTRALHANWVKYDQKNYNKYNTVLRSAVHCQRNSY